ncbi:hypothetical protein [Methylophilus sp.]|uniref:hypothetical protein n=1 Tax=Methylophilus sp. TaxID=29541 RepID=UPI0011D7B38F|nr:hypothetical protein [Methylophilus sp.]TXI46042.1 MAG: hypothetical protein E6Q52_04555 [Methylophilus sp.]
MNKLTTRTIKHYLPDEFTDEKPVNLHDCMFTLKDGSHIDIGAMCFRVFSERVSRKTDDSPNVRQVDISTLDTNRNLFLANLIDALRSKPDLRPSSKRTHILLIIQFIFWIGKHLPGFDITVKEHVKNAYIEYTKWLFHRIKLKDGHKLKMKNNSASVCQKVARSACSYMTNQSEREIEFWGSAIRWDDRDSFVGTLTNKIISDDDKLKTYAALCDFIHQTWCVLIEKSQNSISVDQQILVFDQGQIGFKKLYSKVSVAALMSFIGATGANLQVALDAEIDKFEFDQTQKYTRLSGTKVRANNKTVFPEFASKYLSVWKKWLDIRNFWLQRYGFTSNLAFPFINENGLVTPMPSSMTDRSKANATFFEDFYSITWINARIWRGFKSKLIGKASENDIFASADMQGHNISTALRHYSNRNLADASLEISNALNAVYQSAIDRTRYKPTISVPIVAIHNPNTTTAIGECTSEGSLKPYMAEGFTLFAPIPNCSVKETCIFCDKYAAHADSIDIRKLLSLKFLINELGNSMPQDEWSTRWASYIYRIDEILNEIVGQDPSLINLVDQIQEDVELGGLDEFWLDYYETLTHLGVVA